MLRVARLSPSARLPERGLGEAAGYDLFADCGHALVIAPGEREVIELGIAMQPPEGHFARIEDRSGHALKLGLTFLGRILDRDYTGEVKLVALNTGRVPIIVKQGMKIAQAVLYRITTPEVAEVASLGDTARAGAGFGSTGS